MTEREIGVVTHYFGHVDAGVVQLSDRLMVGDEIHIKGAHDDISMTVTSMQLDHANVREGMPGQSIAIQVPSKVHAHDRVYRIEN